MNIRLNPGHDIRGGNLVGDSSHRRGRPQKEARNSETLFVGAWLCCPPFLGMGLPMILSRLAIHLLTRAILLPTGENPRHENKELQLSAGSQAAPALERPHFFFPSFA